MTNNSQGNQLTRDLNIAMANGKRWNIPFFWAPLIKYISAPILAIVFSFTFPLFHENRGNPLHIFAFTVCNLTILLVVLGFIVPKWFDVFVPADRKHEGKVDYYPGTDATPIRAHEMDGPADRDEFARQDYAVQEFTPEQGKKL
jgi:solute carrier family 6 GABA transporter-like protein 1